MRATWRRWVSYWDIEKNSCARSRSCHRALKLWAGALYPSAVSPDRQPFPPERDQAERRQLTVMFCDLVDSTALSRRLDPEDLQDIIRRFLDACSQAIGRFNGYIAKYMGDGMLVYFGYPHAHEDDAERAVHAGLAILDTVKALNRKKPNQSLVLLHESGSRLVRSSSANSWGRTPPRNGQCSAKPQSCRSPPSTGTTQSTDH